MEGDEGFRKTPPTESRADERDPPSSHRMSPPHRLVQRPQDRSPQTRRLSLQTAFKATRLELSPISMQGGARVFRVRGPGGGGGWGWAFSHPHPEGPSDRRRQYIPPGHFQ